MSTTSTVILHYQDRPGHSVKHPRSHHHRHYARSKNGGQSATVTSIIGRRFMFPLSLLTFLHLLTWSSCSSLLIAPLIAANLNSTSTTPSAVVQVQVPLKDGGDGFASTFSSTTDSSKSASVPAVISHGNNSTIESSQPTSSSLWTSSEISGNLSTTNWPVIAQRQQVGNEAVVANQERTGRASPTEHSTFLLFCSANSIRYWSASCPVHASASLLIKDRSSSIPHGISSLALWRPLPEKASNSSSNSTSAPVQLLWYDAEEGAFHRAAIHRKRSSTFGSNPDCDNLLGVAYNETLRLGGDDKDDDFGEETAEARVKLAVDSRRHLLFASRFQNSRLDVFQLDVDNSTAVLEHLATVSTLHPYEIALDEREQVLFWVEDKARICRLEYGAFLVPTSTNAQNLTAFKHCTKDLSAGPQALTLDTARLRVLWGDRNGRLYSLDDYYFASGSTAKGDVISQPGDPHSVNNLAMSGRSTDALYLSDDQDLYRFNLTTGHSEVVSIESNIQFGLLVLEDLPEEEEGEDDIVTTTMAPTTTISTSTASDNDHHPFTSSSTPNIDPFSSTTTSTLSPLLPTSTASPNTTSSPSVPFLVFTLVPSLVVLLLLLLTLIICCCSHHHPMLAEAQQRLHLNPDSFKARTSAILGRRFTRYAQLRKERASSTARDQLINDAEAGQSDGGDLESSAADVTSCCTPEVSRCCQQEHKQSSPTTTATSCCGSGITNNSFYRSNIMRQHPASAVQHNTSTTIEDIEDIFGGSGGATTGQAPSSRSSSHVHRPCMACRDVDLCAEKGFCMATYRVY